MPGCLQSRDGEENTKEREWREPPGYLGEAVRRAKLIPNGRPPQTPPD